MGGSGNSRRIRPRSPFNAVCLKEGEVRYEGFVTRTPETIARFPAPTYRRFPGGGSGRQEATERGTGGRKIPYNSPGPAGGRLARPPLPRNERPRPDGGEFAPRPENCGPPGEIPTPLAAGDPGPGSSHRLRRGRPVRSPRGVDLRGAPLRPAGPADRQPRPQRHAKGLADGAAGRPRDRVSPPPLGSLVRRRRRERAGADGPRRRGAPAHREHHEIDGGPRPGRRRSGGRHADRHRRDRPDLPAGDEIAPDGRHDAPRRGPAAAGAAQLRQPCDRRARARHRDSDGGVRREDEPEGGGARARERPLRRPDRTLAGERGERPRRRAPHRRRPLPPEARSAPRPPRLGLRAARPPAPTFGGQLEPARPEARAGTSSPARPASPRRPAAASR